MSGKVLWELGEVYTAPLNLFLIVLGVSFSNYLTGNLWDWRLILYLIVMGLYHVAVNIFNNYMDYVHASDKHDYKTSSNVIGRESLSLKMVWRFFLIFMAGTVLVGAVLVWYTDWWVLFVGILGTYIGLFYSYGPRPLNSLPIAETLTSLASGFLVPLVAAYIVIDQGNGMTPLEIGKLFLVSSPMVLMMFNNLLANNTCDLKEDRVNGRKTLVHYIGQVRAVRLLQVAFTYTLILLPVLVLLELAPFTVLGILLIAPRLWKNLQEYFVTQDKATTFPLVLKTMSTIMVVYPFLYFLGSFI